MSETRTLFLTGATGRTGREVLRLLLKRGYTVRCLVRGGPDHKASSMLAAVEHPQIQPIKGDLEDSGSAASGWVPDWAESLEGCDAAIHVAGIGLVESVVKACEKQSVDHLICVSSTRRFTSFPDPTAERVIESEDLIEQSGLRATILQSTMIYGGGRDQNVARIAAWIKRRRWMPLVASGASLIQPIHAYDVAAAIICALENTLRHPKTTPTSGVGGSLVSPLVIAGPEAMTWRAMIETIAASAGKNARFIPIPAALAAQAAQALDILNISRPISSAEIRRQFEDRDFDIGPALAALPGWRPRPFDPKN